MGDLERVVNQSTLKRKNAELQRVNKDLDSYVHFVSHDLKETLRHLKGLLQFINEGYGAKLDETGKEHLMEIITMGDDANNIINKLLELSKMLDKEKKRLKR